MTKKRFKYYEHKGADYILENPNEDLDFIEMLGDCLDSDEIVNRLNELYNENERLKEENNEIDKLKRANNKLNKLCVKYGCKVDRLETENENLEITIAAKEALINVCEKKFKELGYMISCDDDGYIVEDLND